MGMSSHVVGVRPPGGKWLEMKAAYDACLKADVPVPEEVRRFFGHDKPDDAGVIVPLEGSVCCRIWGDDSREGFEVDVTKLPPGVTVVRFYNSY